MRTYKIADVCFGLEAIYDRIYDLYKDYAFEGEPEFVIATAEDDIEFEREKSRREREIEGLRPMEFEAPYLETLAAYRKLAAKMTEYNTFLFHGSVIAVDGQAYLFTAKSGTGKSTHTRLWRQLLGERAVMVNDDKPLLKVTDSGVTVYGTPYNGKHDLGCNMSAPLKAICIIERGEQNSIESITSAAAYEMLLQQVYRPGDPAALARTLGLIDLACKHISLYRLKANMDISAAELAFGTMSK